MWKTGTNKCFLNLHCCLFILCRNAISSEMRQGKWIEDTPIGVCHRQGVGWNGGSASVVDGNDKFEDVMPVYWNRLVERPECVDRVEIYMDV